jgi:FdrA protein
VSVERVSVRRGLYQDSVTLMQLSRDVGASTGVTAALVAMATDLNLDVLTAMGFQLPADLDSANELLIAIRADSAAAADLGLARADELLAAPRRTPAAGAGSAPQPRTIGSLVRTSGSGLALISVPGQHAFTEAMDALESDCDVLIFSDNVSVQQEIDLKEVAAERGRLVMGPDCGTAVVGGIGLGFAHTLDAGPVGLVAASGTGAQQVLCLLDAAGVGITAALGVGGRDLSEAVAGRSSIAAIRMLDDDPATELILVVSKPPADAIGRQLRELAGQLRTPVQFALLGPGEPDLTAATEQALARLGRGVPSWPSWIADGRPARAGGALRGLFCGGTLCDEAMLIASAELGAVYSNTPLRSDWTLDESLRADGHYMIDFGDDALTRGRPHPMIDPSLRTRYLQAALDDARSAVILLDVVLGHGAHSDPVAELLPLVENSAVPVVVSVIGARRDPQSLNESASRLHRAGASAFTSNAAAARHALALIRKADA